MGCSSSKIIDMTNQNKAADKKNIFPKEKKVEAILISKKIHKGNEIQEKIINICERNDNNLLLIKRENSEDKQKQIVKNNSDFKNENAIRKFSNDSIEKKDLTLNNNKYKGSNISNDLNNQNNLSANDELNKLNSNKNNQNINLNNTNNQNNNPAIVLANNSNDYYNNKNNNNHKLNYSKSDKIYEEEKELTKIKQINNNLLKEEIEKCEIKNNFNTANESAISKLSSNLIKSKIENLKDTNIAKDENELILNLTKMQNLTHFQDDNNTKNLLNSIEKDDNLILKFNTGPAANSLLNNTNFKINESQSQQNISNINNNPSICEENKSDRLSFKFDLTSNFDLNSKFSKFDSTNNISRIKVPYYENHNNNNNNYEQNYTLTNASNMNDLNNLTNLNNNLNNNENNNNNNINYKNLKQPPVPKHDKNTQDLRKTLKKDGNENMDEEAIQLSITLSVRASKFEAMYPIWVEKDREVEFKVIGKWTIDNTFPMCDCNGYIIKNKKETCNSNINNINNSNITNSTNYNTASTNNTNLNININSKNINSNNLVLLNSPTANKMKNSEEACNKESHLIEVDKNLIKTNFNKASLPDNEDNANVNINLENTNKNNNEVKISYISPTTVIMNETKSESQNKKMEDADNNENNNNNKGNQIEAEFNINNNINKKENNNKSSNNLNCLLENYPNGCLIGRVLGGPYFRISSKYTFISEFSGPLFLKMNIHDLRLNPEGKLSVFINGAEDLPFMSIEKKLGWDINSLSLGCQLLKSESERLIYTFINKIRINSNLFAQQYLENIKTLSNTTNSLYVCLYENKKTFPLLNMDARLLDFGKKLLKREIERLYNISNNNSNVISNLNKEKNLTLKNRQEILENENKQIYEFEKILNLSGYNNLKYFIKKHEDTKPLSVSIKLIIDDKARHEILSGENNSIGLITIKLPQAQKGFYTCLVFGNLKSEKNLITEINKNESEIMMTD